MDLLELGRGPTRRHPWETARVRALRRILDSSGALERATRVLDIGCGDAFTVETLFSGRRGCGIDAVDPHLTADQAARIARERPGVTLHTSLRGLPAGAYDVVTLLDTLEHADDDLGLLDQAVGLAAPGGFLLVTVPAFPALFSSHDRFLGHRRRYRRARLERLARDANLCRVSGGWLFPDLVPLRALAVVAERAVGPPRTPAGVGAWRGSAAVTRALEAWWTAENRVALGLGAVGLAPPGLTLWMLCRRPHS